MIKKGDLLIKKYDDTIKQKVLTIIDDCYLLSETTDHNMAGMWRTLKEIEDNYILPKVEGKIEYNDMCWVIYHQGDIKQLKWHGNAFDNGVKDFLGIYPDQKSAEEARNRIRQFVRDNLK